MNEKDTTEPQRGQAMRKENRRRATFLIKLILLVCLIYINVRYDIWMSSLDIQGHPLEGIASGLVKAALFILMANLLISLGRIILVALYMRRKTQRSRENNVVLAINRIASLLNGAVMVIAVFLLSDIKWEDFFGTFSLVAVATVLLTKDYISNTVNGLINMMSDRLALGDHVKIGAHEGEIRDITLSNVYLEDEEGHSITIPNNTVFAAEIINFSHRPGELVEVPIEVRPQAVHELASWEVMLKESLQPFQSQLIQAGTKLQVRSISIDKVQLIAQFRMKHANPNRKKELVHAILQRFITSTVTA
ncbi:MAG: mechanosensitive ion channel [Cyclobacteriaceae bacterium]